MVTSLRSLLVVGNCSILVDTADVSAHSQKLKLKKNSKSERSKNRSIRNWNKNLRRGLNSLKNDYKNMKDKRIYEIQKFKKKMYRKNQKYKKAEELASMNKRLKLKT